MSQCLPAVWRQALCWCLIIVSQQHTDYCHTIHSIFCRTSIGHFPRILYSSSFLLLCKVPVRAYRKTNDKGAELSDHSNCGTICIYSFWVVYSLAGGMSDNLQPLLYTRVSSGKCLLHMFRAFMCPVNHLTSKTLNWGLAGLSRH